MSQADKSKGTSLRKGAKKGEGRELETRVAEAADPRDPAQKQAVDHHSEFQKLTQRAAELEAQVGEL
ncbi:MAG: hypothetical protein HY293_00340, partial [Planctomycetes bacterium]|nr:hypothetical protein [Planctomycetota bacterium]